MIVDLTYMARIWRVFSVPKLGKAANKETCHKKVTITPDIAR
jgi:hypothetical protein